MMRGKNSQIQKHRGGSDKWGKEGRGRDEGRGMRRQLKRNSVKEADTISVGTGSKKGLTDIRLWFAFHGFTD